MENIPRALRTWQPPQRKLRMGATSFTKLTAAPPFLSAVLAVDAFGVAGFAAGLAVSVFGAGLAVAAFASAEGFGSGSGFSSGSETPSALSLLWATSIRL